MLPVIITVLVSLSMFGAALMVGNGVDNATERWEGGIEFVVWMNPDATAEQDAVIQQTLEESEGTTIREWTYVDQQATFEEFQEIFAGEPELLDAVTAEDLPPSYRVAPIDVVAFLEFDSEMLAPRFRASEQALALL